MQSHVDGVALPEDYAVLVFQSVRELLFNVLKHAGTDAATVEAFVSDQCHLHICVVDSGIGFDAKTLGSTTAKGYGLFSIQERIEGLGGTFTVRSSPGSGTHIELSVPIPDMVEVSDAAAEAQSTSDAAPGSPRLCRMMIVDDHVLIRQEIASLLTSMENVTVIGEACDGCEAVELARTLRPELILMDINLPGIDGIEATRQILDHSPEIKIIGITINTDAAVHAGMIAAGAMASLNKESLYRDIGPTLSRILDQRVPLSSS